MRRTEKCRAPKAPAKSNLHRVVFYSPQLPTPARRFRRQRRERTAPRSTANSDVVRESREAPNACLGIIRQAPRPDFQLSTGGDAREMVKTARSAARIRRES